MSNVHSIAVGDAGSFGSSGWEIVESYTDYQDAQRAVDRLSDASFAVENVEIVGGNLRLVERVTGRLTSARAAAAGAGTGAWFGLFIGLFVGLFTTGPEWLGLVLGGLVIGAFWGGVFGFVVHRAMHGQRDFASTSALTAGQYDIMVGSGEAEQARKLLAGSR